MIKIYFVIWLAINKLLSIIFAHLGLLAQLVEQLTFNQLVAGSNPAQPTITIFKTSFNELVFLCLYILF